MAGKRRIIVNGVAVSLETPHPVSGVKEKGVKSDKHIQVSYSQALEHWGVSITAEVWQGLNGESKTAWVSRKQFELLQQKPTVMEAGDTITQIMERSQSQKGGKD